MSWWPFISALGSEISSQNLQGIYIGWRNRTTPQKFFLDSSSMEFSLLLFSQGNHSASPRNCFVGLSLPWCTQSAGMEGTVSYDWFQYIFQRTSEGTRSPSFIAFPPAFFLQRSLGCVCVWNHTSWESSSLEMPKGTLFIAEKACLRIPPMWEKVKTGDILPRASGEHSHVAVPKARNLLGNMREVKLTTCLCLLFLLLLPPSLSLSPSPSPPLFSHPASLPLSYFSLRYICHCC